MGALTSPVYHKLYDGSLKLHGAQDPSWHTHHGHLGAGRLSLAKGQNRRRVLAWIKTVSEKVKVVSAKRLTSPVSVGRGPLARGRDRPHPGRATFLAFPSSSR